MCGVMVAGSAVPSMLHESASPRWKAASISLYVRARVQARSLVFFPLSPFPLELWSPYRLQNMFMSLLNVGRKIETSSIPCDQAQPVSMRPCDLNALVAMVALQV